MVKAFDVSIHLSGLLDSYPDARHLIQVATEGGRASRDAISRLWLSEGIPYAFKEQPGLYESIRAWLGERLGVDPKEISLAGSARIGQSLAPRKLGEVFSERSDLDLFVVSTELFERMVADFKAWSTNFSLGIETPSEREKVFWDDNKSRGENLIKRGFLDSKMIPNRENYRAAREIAQSMYLLKEKLAVTEGAPRFTYASIRCYRNWGSYVRQMSMSLV
ncbi:MAG: hypothetical protein L0H10_24110 [Comamonas sp.]|nr:hypothetical protein [Comamonas sp.]